MIRVQVMAFLYLLVLCRYVLDYEEINQVRDFTKISQPGSWFSSRHGFTSGLLDCS